MVPAHQSSNRIARGNPAQIDIQARDFPLTDALRSHAERRLRFTLTHCDDHIQKIVIQLSIINSPCESFPRQDRPPVQ